MRSNVARGGGLAMFQHHPVPAPPLSTALKLRHIDADVIVIDQRNHHLFQPLL